MAQYLITWFEVVGTLWGGLGSAALWEELCSGDGL